MTLAEAKKIIKSECYIADLLNLDRTQMVNTALDTVIEAAEETRWIPASERLPENAFGCLVTVEEDDIYGEPQSVIYPEFVGYDGETWNDADGDSIPFEVLAWRPLPQPYKAEGSDEE